MKQSTQHVSPTLPHQLLRYLDPEGSRRSGRNTRPSVAEAVVSRELGARSEYGLELAKLQDSAPRRFARFETLGWIRRPISIVTRVIPRPGCRMS